MHLGLVIPFDGRPGRTMRELVTVAREAEAAGLHSLWFPEHVVFFPTYTSRYPYSPDGDPHFSRRQGVYDPLFASTVAASVTDRIRVGTSVLIVPQRNPVVLAQEVVAVDHASSGRFDFGVGIGWSREEFAALGVPWDRRGSRTDDYLAAMKSLWRDEAVVSYDGEYVRFDGVVAEPKPIQIPHPPIWVGGGAGPAMQRAARIGDGWFGWGVELGDIASTMRELDEACVAAERDPATVGRMLGRPIADASAATMYVDGARASGVGEVVFAFGHTIDHLRRGIETLASLS